jgi:hypothetical protein
MKRDHLQHFDHLIADLQPGSFLFRRISIDVISKRFALKYPFSFDHEGFYRMQYARLKNGTCSGDQKFSPTLTMINLVFAL